MLGQDARKRPNRQAGKPDLRRERRGRAAVIEGITAKSNYLLVTNPFKHNTGLLFEQPSRQRVHSRPVGSGRVYHE
jgi:hypothetical protein